MKMSSCIGVLRVAAVIGLTFVVLAGSVLPTLAASPSSPGGIDGFITCDGTPLVGVVVAVTGPHPSTIDKWVGTTQADGRFFTDMLLPPGTYTVRHYYFGPCQFAERSKVAVAHAGTITTVHFAGTPCSELIRNGSFEHFEAWHVGPTPWPARYSTTQYRTGLRSMRSGIEPSEADLLAESSFYQSVSVPANATSVTLSFWYRPRTEEGVNALSTWQDVSWAGYAPETTIAGQELDKRMAVQQAGPGTWYYYDWQEVLVLDQQYRLLEVLHRGLSNAGQHDWINKSFDLTPYRGRTINIYFNTINNGTGGKRTWMFVDDVSVLSCVAPPDCGVTPTTEWVNLYGLNSRFDGAPLQSGQIIHAYSPGEVLSGCFVVRSDGRYGAMAVYADDPDTHIVEGLRPGEPIRLKVDGRDAILLGPDDATWTGHGDVLHVELAVGGQISRHISLQSGWNLISFDVMPANSATASVLAPIAGRFTRVLGSTCTEGGLSYYPHLPPGMNTLKRMDPYHGYWIHMASAATLTISGPEVPETAPLRLCNRWNLVGYLPNGPLAVTEALHSIVGKYTVVLGYDGGALSFYPQLPPAMNSLTHMRPGFGYWIRPTKETSLVYPTASSAMVTIAAVAPTPAEGVTPTYRWADAYSLESTFEGKPLPVGAVIEVFTPAGLKVGHSVVQDEGRYGPMPIYGDDPSTPEIDGAQAGEELVFTVNGRKVLTTPERPTWQGTYALMAIDLFTEKLTVKRVTGER